jgi:hypothetical protein
MMLEIYLYWHFFLLEPHLPLEIYSSTTIGYIKIVVAFQFAAEIYSWPNAKTDEEIY